MEINRPFDGTMVPISAYKKNARVFSIMLELNRSLYLDEQTGERSSRFQSCRDGVSLLLRNIWSNTLKE